MSYRTKSGAQIHSKYFYRSKTPWWIDSVVLPWTLLCVIYWTPKWTLHSFLNGQLIDWLQNKLELWKFVSHDRVILKTHLEWNPSYTDRPSSWMLINMRTWAWQCLLDTRKSPVEFLPKLLASLISIPCLQRRKKKMSCTLSLSYPFPKCHSVQVKHTAYKRCSALNTTLIESLLNNTHFHIQQKGSHVMRCFYVSKWGHDLGFIIHYYRAIVDIQFFANCKNEGYQESTEVAMLSMKRQ